MDEQRPTLLDFIKTHKKLLIAATAGVLIVVITSAVLIFQQNSKVEKDTGKDATKKQTSQSVELNFNPYDITADKNFPYRTTNIELKSGRKDITGIELVMLYDPTALRDVSVIIPRSSVLKEHGAFKVLKNEVNKQEGIITVSIGITDTKKPLSKDGVLVAFNYTLIPGFTKPTTAVAFLKKSAVTQAGADSSILTTTKPLIIRTGK